MEVRDAATVILVRDRPDLQVFVLRRNHTLEFVPGATVFPGGAVDPDDRTNAEALGLDEFRVAAARECLEEAGIPIDPVALIPFARWVTPEGAPRRYDTRFFVAAAPDGHEGEHDGSELVASAWMRPADVLAAFDRGEVELILPTQRSLEALVHHERVASLLAELGEAQVGGAQVGGTSCPT